MKLTSRFRRRSQAEEVSAARRSERMKAIADLDPHANADAAAVEERLRNMSYGSTRNKVA